MDPHDMATRVNESNFKEEAKEYLEELKSKLQTDASNLEDKAKELRMKIGKKFALKDLKAMEGIDIEGGMLS